MEEHRRELLLHAGGSISNAQEPLLARNERRRRSIRRRTKTSSRAFSESVTIALICTAVVSLGQLSYGFSSGYTSPTQSAMMTDLNLSVSQFSVFGSMSNVGGMLGALVSGKLSDFLGRKGALVAAAVPHVLGWIAIASAQGVYALYIGRLLVGFGVGIITFTVPIYISEISPMQMRGTLGTANQLFVALGILLAYLIGMAIEWRGLAVAGVIPCTLLILSLFFIPESPRWLAKVGWDDDFKASLQVLRGKKSDISDELEDIKDSVANNQNEAHIKFSGLLRKKYMQPLAISAGLLILQQLGGINGVVYYAGTIFDSAGFSSADLASLSTAVLQIAGTVVSAALVDKLGRRVLLMVSTGGTTIGCFLVGISYYLREHFSSSKVKERMSILSVAGLLLDVTAFSVGLGAIPWIIMSEVLPANVKELAGSIATVLNWFCAFLITYTFNFMLNWSFTGSFGIFAGISAITAAFVVLYVPETKGKTLEEIQTLFA